MKLKPIQLKNISIDGLFWAPRIKQIGDIVIPYQWEIMNDRVHGAEKSGAVQNFKIAAGREKGEFYGCVFQDSDLGKWLEAVAYKLSKNQDEKLEKLADDLIDMIAEAQDENGYLVTYYLIKKDEKRWTNLRDNHELYVIGHLLEAAVAYYEATGKRKFMDVMIKTCDLVIEVFGTEDGKLTGYPGHEEIELALVKLYRTTGIKKYLDLSKYFIDERGKQPCCFTEESSKRGVDPICPWGDGSPKYWQAHLPVREQTTAEGHAVRAMYLYSAMADLGLETDDADLKKTCRILWKNVVTKRMYITGGVGTSHDGERFTFDYDLPNETSYAETCAAIGLVFFAHRMLNAEINNEYADVMERALYNGVLSGISLDGKSYFYVNPLAGFPNGEDTKSLKRFKWHGCACCPPNLSRLLTSLGSYCYSHDETGIYAHLYTGGSAQFNINNQAITIEQTTEYPWKEKVTMKVSCKNSASFTLALRVPGWCRNAKISINNEKIAAPDILNGYARLNRNWSDGDIIELTLPMPVEKVKSHPKVRMNAGRIALQRGPVVYCIEEIDNGKDLNDIILSNDSKFEVLTDHQLLDEIPVITTKGWRSDLSKWENQLYRAEPNEFSETTVTAVPYFLWANREVGEMLVWIRNAF